MYTILVTDDNTLNTSIRERIMQRSNLVDNLHFLTTPLYKNEIDMTDFTVNLEYMLPVSKQYKSEILTKSEDLYKDEYLEYILPFDTKITSEVGDVELQLTFIKADMDADGNSIQYVRKTSPTVIKILPIAKWSDIVPDEALNAVDQKLLAIDARINQIAGIEEALESVVPDDLALSDDNVLQLSVKGTPTGNGVEIYVPDDDEDSVSDGIKDLDEIVYI
jgi:hypothetical protein